MPNQATSCSTASKAPVRQSRVTLDAIRAYPDEKAWRWTRASGRIPSSLQQRDASIVQAAQPDLHD